MRLDRDRSHRTPITAQTPQRNSSDVTHQTVTDCADATVTRMKQWVLGSGHRREETKGGVMRVAQTASFIAGSTSYRLPQRSVGDWTVGVGCCVTRGCFPRERSPRGRPWRSPATPTGTRRQPHDTRSRPAQPNP
eukprot:4125344-Prymnesium_polylepis.2